MRSTTFLLLFLILIMCGSVFLFWQGFHNSDLGFNMEKVNDMGSVYKDIGGDGKIRTATNLWLLGGKQMIYGFWFLLTSALLSGYLIGYNKREVEMGKLAK